MLLLLLYLEGTQGVIAKADFKAEAQPLTTNSLEGWSRDGWCIPVAVRHYSLPATHSAAQRQLSDIRSEGMLWRHNAFICVCVIETPAAGLVNVTSRNYGVPVKSLSSSCSSWAGLVAGQGGGGEEELAAVDRMHRSFGGQRDR